MGRGGGGVVFKLGRPGEGGANFVWVIYTRLGGGLLVTNCLSTWACFN